MNDKARDYWERGHLYARLYHETIMLTDFERAVIETLGQEHLGEAKIAWAAIDQYVGTYQPQR